jgi:hypothetical protein
VATVLTLLMVIALIGAIVYAVQKQWVRAGVLGALFVVLFIVHGIATAHSRAAMSASQQGNFPLPLSTSINAQPK